MSTRIRVGTFNHHDGGGEPGDWSRLDAQAEDLIARDYAVLVSTEGKHWLRNDAEGLRRLQDALGMQPYLAHAPRHDCHVTIWINPDHVHHRQTIHQERPPYWHALAAITADIDGFDEPVTILGAHLAPFDPAWRIGEAMTLTEFCDRYALLAGDLQDPGIDEDDTIWNHAPKRKQVRHARHLGQTSATVLHDQGWIDIGAAQRQDPTTRPRTAGFPHHPVRCDKILLSEALADRCEIADYQVGPHNPTQSDHCRVDTDLELT